ncbi:ABC transporter [Lacticaseibacillus brantae DSM 23927]|uniref:ABC transporter n=2 Tax=Lacticaseibacillus brantae TaxID=943673 RepID=A0A0R2B8J4_9LACO|nr:ABC transporter [Lacticaseibacillus brantae DSM 23927]
MGIDFGLWLLGFAIGYVNDIYQTSLTQRMNADMRQDLMQSAQFGVAAYRRNSEAYYASGMMNDINQINTNGFAPFYGLIQTVGIIVFSTAAIVFLQWRLMVVTVLLGVIAIVLPRTLNRLMTRSSERLSAANEQALNTYSETVKGTETLLGMGLVAEIFRRIAGTSTKLKQENIHFTIVSGMVRTVAAVISVGNQLILLAYTGWLILQGQTQIGTILSIASLAGLFFSGTRSIGGDWALVKSNATLFKKFNQQVQASPSQLSTAPADVAFSLNQITYAPTPNHNVLTDYSLTMPAGQKYFITGPSGSGKSTILNLLTERIAPQAGTVAIGLPELTYLSQNPIIFSDTIRYNLTLDESFSDAAIAKALAVTRLTDEVAAMPDGLDTVLVDGGQNISGGQKQRLALARALIRQPRFLLMDESTSAVDPKNEYAILKAITADSDLSLVAVIHTNDQTILDLADEVVAIG